jgi:ribokinase
MILVFGSINVDLILRVKAFAKPGETVLTERYQTEFGGKGANQAVAAARARRDRTLRIVMASAVGNDAFGRDSIDNLAANGIDTSAIRTSTEPTGCAFIAVDHSGENAITVASGANRTARASDVSDDLLGAANVIVLQMEVPSDEILALASRAKRLGTARVLLNLAPMPDDIAADLLNSLLAVTDILVANEHEALAAHAQLTGRTGNDHEAAMAEIARTQNLTGIVTLGGRGAAAMFPDGSRRQAAALPVEVVDTTGAGDTFVGILATGLAEQRPLGQALDRACRGASLACLRLGAQAGMPDADALDRG